jgi:hypothetical protein
MQHIDFIYTYFYRIQIESDPICCVLVCISEMMRILPKKVTSYALIHANSVGQHILLADRQKEIINGLRVNDAGENAIASDNLESAKSNGVRLDLSTIKIYTNKINMLNLIRV